MTRRVPAAVAIALSFVALVAVIVQSRSNPRGEDPQARTVDSRESRTELHSLDTSVSNPTSKTESQSIDAPVAAWPDPEVSLQLDVVWRKLDEMERLLAPNETNLVPWEADQVFFLPVCDAASLRVRVLDATKTPHERVLALVHLRRTAPEERAGVVESMAALLETSGDAYIRADVIRHMHGVDSPRLKQAVLQALSRDENAMVRQQAARNLDTWVSELEVRAALEDAGSSDRSDQVRKCAKEMLSGE